MASAIPGFTATTPTNSNTSTTAGGVTSMTSDGFLKVMLAQLAQQDPLNPTDSNQMLTQMAQISSLQSNQQMTTSLKGLTLQQSIAAGSSMMGKTVQGVDAAGNNANGVVSSVKVVNQSVMLELDSGSELPLANVIQITPATTTAGA
ncbi:MAG: flagellar hook capping FlgD N-terminal domain-containing protein [Phycisphaerae bacterium]